MPLLEAAPERPAGDTRARAVCASISARVGSITDNGLGGWHSYRASKAALNQLNKTMAIEAARKKKVSCIVMHPGWLVDALNWLRIALAHLSGEAHIRTHALSRLVRHGPEPAVAEEHPP